MADDPGRLIATLTDLEIELQRPDVRRDRRRLEELLHRDFFEVGRSGRTYRRGDVLTELPVGGPTPAQSRDFDLRVLAEGVALLTYRSANVTRRGELEQHALRTSIWLRASTGWQIVFHQATPIGDTEED
jgi:hypothetical protein